MQLSHPSSRTSLAGLPAASAMLSPPHAGAHSHFWSRVFSRRNFIAGAVGAAGLAMAPNLAFPTEAEAEGTAPGLFCSPSPSPIVGGTQIFGPGTELFHIFLPAPGSEVSTVGNFQGSVGLASGHGTGTINGDTPVTFANDTRFMTGSYVGQDGKKRKGTFAFV
ncbi:MAG TPA: twin-arginine translocation signal domain-containing protein [Terriglobales bacterium]|nr:twin-arginine translocation signal domain-containing protein [Terriglobales bacterium]